MPDLPAPPQGKKGWPWSEAPEPSHAAETAGFGWPRITVVTPSYNQGVFIEETIRSVLLQGYPNLEYIIIDGGSSDQTVDVIRKYEKWIAYWVSERDRGQAHALSKGFARSSGDILAWLNSDDWYYPEALSLVATMFRADLSLGCLYGDCAVVDSSSEVIRTIYTIPFDREIFLFEHYIVPQPAAFWRRRAYEQVDGINSDISFCMDYDLWARFMLAGVKFSHIPVILAAFRLHSDSKTSRLEHVRRREISEILDRISGPASQLLRMRIPFLRLKRYVRRPASFIEGVKYRLRRAFP